MKKIFLLTFLILFILIITAGNSFAYSIVWDNWRYYSGIMADGNFETETYDRSPISYQIDDNNYGRAKSGKLILKSESKAVSFNSLTIDSLSLFYARFTLSGGAPDEKVPSYLNANLKGFLNGDSDFASSVNAGILIYGNNIGFANIIDAIESGSDLPQPKWSWEYSEEMTSGDLRNIDYNYSELIYPKSDKHYFALGYLATEADVNCPSRARSDFYGANRYFTMDIAPVPEPASLSLLGLGLLGLVGLRKKKIT